MLLKSNYTKTLLAVSIAATVCTAQNVNISGTVTDTGGTAIEGAIVLLEKGGLADTTGADGSFTLTGTTGINDGVNESKPHTLSATINNGLMRINIAEKSAVEINTYTLQGKVVSSIKKTLGAGAHSIKLPHLGAGVYMYQVKIGSERLLIKNCSISGGTSESTHGSSSIAFTQQANGYFLMNDTIRAGKTGYLNSRVQVTKPDTAGIVIRMLSQDAGTVTDIDGNVYHAIRIGDQVWTVENLQTTRLNDSTAIPLISDDDAWEALATPGYCYFGNTTDSDSIKKFGAMYNWHAGRTGKLAPEGWHVPTTGEYYILEDYLTTNGYNWDGIAGGGDRVAKSLAAQTDWSAVGTIGAPGNDMESNNSSGFTGLPGGFRYHFGYYNLIGDQGNWWTISQKDETNAIFFTLDYDNEKATSDYYYKASGCSVRLVRD